MADDKAKPKENPGETPNKTPDVLKLGEVKAPEKAKEVAVEKTDVKKETTKETSGIKREMLQMEVNPDKDTPTKIDSLDTGGNLESKEQKERFELLQMVTGTTLLAMLFENGHSKETLKSLESITGIGGAIAAKLNPVERTALKKIQEIAAKPGSTIYTALKERWNKLVERAHEIYQGAKKAKENLSAPAKTASGETAKESPTLWGKIGEFASKHPVLTAGIAIAGAYGTYRLMKWIFSSGDSDDEKKEEKKGPGFFEKILGSTWASRLKWGLGISAGIFVLGRLIGNEDVSRWLKKNIGIDITGNRLSQFIIYLSEGKFIEAFKVLFEGPDEHYDLHKRMAEKISKETGTEIKPETLKKIGGVKYDDFMSIVAEGKSSINGLLSQIPGMSLLTGSSADIEEEKAVRRYFEGHKAEIDHFKNPTTTVDQVMGNLDGEEKPAPPPEVAAIDTVIAKLDTPEKKAMAMEIREDLQRLIPEDHIKKIIAEAKKVHYNTEKLEKLLADRKRAFDELKESMAQNAEKEVISQKAQKLFEINNALGDERNAAMDEIMKRHGWTETQALAATHLPKFIDWFRQPAWKKEYGKYLLTKYIKAPLGMAKDALGKGAETLIGREFKPNATLPEIEADMKKTQAELDTAKTNQPEFEKEARLKPNDDIALTAVEKNKAKTALLEKDMQIHEKRKAISELEAKILDLKTKGASAGEIAQAERALEENKSFLRSYTHERVKIQGDFLEARIRDQRLIFLKEFGSDGKKAVLSKGYIDQMDALQGEIGSHRKQIESQIAARMEEAEKLAKEGKDIKGLAREINELQKTRVKIDLGAVDSYQKLAKSWTKTWDLYAAMNGGVKSAEVEQAMRQEKNEMQRLWGKMLGGQSEAAGKSVSAGLVHTMKGKMYFYGAFMALGSAINLADKKESEDWSKAIQQAGVDTLPFVSTYSDFRAAITGEEWITKRKLDTADRGVRALFGVGSVLCDMTEFAGVFMRMRAGYGAMKEARTVGKSVEIGEALRAAEKEGKAIDSIEALREMSKTGHWVQKMAMGGAIGALGYGLIYKPVAEMQLEPETKAILGDGVKDLNIDPPPIGTSGIKAP